MSQSLYTLQEVAHRLGLNVRTVRAYVRTGRLKAAKIGKQYRVSRESFEALTGDSGSLQRDVSVASVVEVSAANPDLANRISNLLIGAAGSDQDEDAPLRADSIHDPVRATLKIVVIGNLSATAALFKLVQAVLEQ